MYKKMMGIDEMLSHLFLVSTNLNITHCYVLDVVLVPLIVELVDVHRTTPDS